ncbi:hypothetical protein LCGC14_1560350, partial [marine sediment metagenome]
QKHFIRGYFDGDGSIYVNKIKGRGSSIKITSNKEFIDEVKKILETETHSHFSYYQHAKGITDISTCGDIQVKKILDWLYSKSNIYLKRKYASYQEINKKRTKRCAFI